MIRSFSSPRIFAFFERKASGSSPLASRSASHFSRSRARFTAAFLSSHSRRRAATSRVARGSRGCAATFLDANQTSETARRKRKTETAVDVSSAAAASASHASDQETSTKTSALVAVHPSVSVAMSAYVPGTSG